MLQELWYSVFLPNSPNWTRPYTDDRRQTTTAEGADTHAGATGESRATDKTEWIKIQVERRVTACLDTKFIPKFYFAKKRFTSY
jgi:hypothetical protein